MRLSNLKSKLVFPFFVALLILIILPVSTASAADATGGNSTNITISGRVIDKTTAEPLPGANVLLVGTSFGAATDINGVFNIYNVPMGTYTVKVKYIGYQEEETDILVKRGEDYFQEFELDYAAVEGEVVTVTAQAKGQMEAINQQLASRTISSIVASDKIQEVPDANAAESVGRLPGVSIKRSSGEGNEVVIRGLQPKLNLITVNGIRMPSTNESNNAVGLAGISQYMLDGIEVRKSLTAQDDADVVGGIVDLKLATADEGFHMNVIADGMYNDLAEDFASYRATVQGSNRFFNNSLGIIAQVNMEKADRSRERYSADYNRDTRQSVNEGVFLTGGSYQLHDIIRDRFGVNVLMDYRLPRGKIQFSSIYNAFDEDRWQRNWDYGVAAGSQSSQKNHNSGKMNSKSFINGFSLETELLKNITFDLSASMTSGIREEPKNNHLKISFYNKTGACFEPEFSENTYGKTGYDAIHYIRDIGEDHILFGVWQDIIDFEENETTVQTNLKIPVALSNRLTGFVKFGGKMRLKDRDYNYDTNGASSLYGGNDAMRTNILEQNPEIDWPWTAHERPEGEEIPAYPLYSDWSQKILEDRILLRNFTTRSIVDQITNRLAATNWGDYIWAVFGAGDVRYDYVGDEELYAGYIMTELNWDTWLTLNAGLRHEQEKTKYRGYGVIDIASQEDIVDTLSASERSNSYLLPSVNLKVKYSEWGDVRLAYSKSLARPDYYAFIPHYYADLRWSLSSTAGNVDLKPSISENFDVTFSFYNNNIGLFTVGGFYKQIEDYYYVRNFKVIDPAVDNEVHGYENITVPKGQYINVWFNSPKMAFVKGLEFDWQTNFWYLPKPFNGLVLNANYTLINSESSYYVADIVKEYYGSKPWEFTEILVDSFQTRRMIDQPNNTFNVSLGYDYKGFSMRVAYYFQGSTLVGKGQYEEDDTFSHDYERWDFSMSQQLPVEGLSIQLLLNNITSVPDQNYKWIKRYHTFEEYYGRTGSIGIKYKF